MTSSIADLVAQVEALEDYEQCSQALMEVVYREPALGARLALNLLATGAGDVYLRASAFGMLYKADRARAFEYIRQHAISSEPYVFGSMLTEITDDVGNQHESQDLRHIAEFLKSAIALRDKSELDESNTVQEKVKAFVMTYGDGLRGL